MAPKILPTAEPVRRQRLRIGLGTWIAIEAAAARERDADAAIEAAFGALREVEGRMHPDRPASDLASINAAAADVGLPSRRQASRRTFPVHPSIWELLILARRLHEASGGVFDPCLPCRPGTLRDVELVPPFKIRCHAPVKLDFGGFAKGYAVDRAVEALEAHGCSAGLVNAGGDLRVFGPRAGDIWLREAGSLRPLELEDAAVAVSDRDEPARPPEHQGYYLRITGRITGRASPRAAGEDGLEAHGKAPDTPPRRAVVIAPRAVIADALTKCVLLCSPAVSRRLLVEFHARSLAGSATAGPCPPPGRR